MIFDKKIETLKIGLAISTYSEKNTEKKIEKNWELDQLELVER